MDKLKEIELLYDFNLLLNVFNDELTNDEQEIILNITSEMGYGMTKFIETNPENSKNIKNKISLFSKDNINNMHDLIRIKYDKNDSIIK